MVHWDNNMPERDVIIFGARDTRHCHANVYPTAIRGVGDPSNDERSAPVSKFPHGSFIDRGYLRTSKLILVLIIKQQSILFTRFLFAFDSYSTSYRNWSYHDTLLLTCNTNATEFFISKLIHIDVFKVENDKIKWHRCDVFFFSDRKKREYRCLVLSRFAFPFDGRSFNSCVYCQVLGFSEEIVLSTIPITLLPTIREIYSYKWMTCIYNGRPSWNEYKVVFKWFYCLHDSPELSSLYHMYRKWSCWIQLTRVCL